MSFLNYLEGKKIDAAAFAAGDAREYAIWQQEFDVLGAAAFDQRKKFQINPCRRRFPLLRAASANAPDATATATE